MKGLRPYVLTLLCVLLVASGVGASAADPHGPPDGHLSPDVRAMLREIGPG
jgi:hypothetical protein